MKIADLYASLGIRTQRAEFARARNELGRFVKSSDKEFKSLGARISASIGNGLGAVRKDLNSGLVKRVGIGALGAGLVMAAKNAMQFDEALTSLDIASRGAMGSMAEVRKRILDVSRASGVSKEELLQGASAFIALTGDGKAAAASLETFARIQKATGASMEDISGAAAALSQQFGIGSEDFERAFSIIVAGGKAGAIEMKDMAAFAAELASQFKTFSGGTGVEGLANMSAAFQIAAQNFGGKSAETATGLKALFSSFTSPRTLKALQELGVEIFTIGKDGTATLKSFPEIFEAMSNTDIVKDPRLLTKVFESSEARRAASAILQNIRGYRDLAAATIHANDIAEDNDKRQASASAKAAKAWNEVKVAVAEAFSPERLQAFADLLATAVEAASRLMNTIKAVSDWVKRNHGSESEPGSDESKLTDEELDNEIEDSRTRWGQLTTSPNKIARLKDERKKRDTATIIGRSTLALSESVAQVNWAAGGGKGPMPSFGLTRSLPGDRGGGQQTITLGGLHVEVKVPPGTDANGIAAIVTRNVRQLWDAAARDIAAGTVE